jgi:predicted ATPase
MITKFRISKLHGYKNYDLNFKDNTLILVGENGAGKTTVLRLLFYVLSGQWSALAKFKFDYIAIEINGNEHLVPYELIERSIKQIDKRILRRFPPSVREKFMQIFEHNESRIITPELEMLCRRYDVPLPFLMDEMDLFERPELDENKGLKDIFSKIRQSFNSQLLYLPTYRRIEQELGLIIKDYEGPESRFKSKYAKKDRNSSCVELIEFGMQDVFEAIKNEQDELKDFARENLNELTLGYLGDVVDKKYSEVDVEEIKNETEGTIFDVLDRIHESILTDDHKAHLFDRINDVRKEGTLDEHARVVCHYFLKLLKFHAELKQKESRISTFCKVCNEYMVDKEFKYDASEFKFTITDVERPIELRHLSSGEKQIVSLFSHLYLSDNEKFFVMIDEPELSLSVPWQRKFLEDIKRGEFCSGLVAVTHSPFIYDNSLKKYARGLGEFTV